jgi:hypothetical protein
LAGGAANAVNAGNDAIIAMATMIAARYFKNFPLSKFRHAFPGYNKRLLHPRAKKVAVFPDAFT